MVKCPVCKVKTPAKNGKILSHGPGKNSFFCEGSGLDPLVRGRI